MTNTPRMHMSIHETPGVKLIQHSRNNGTEWAEIRIGHLTITVYERDAIDDALRLPRDADFTSNIPAVEAA